MLAATALGIRPLNLLKSNQVTMTTQEQQSIVPPARERRVAAVTATLTHQFLQKECLSDIEDDAKCKGKRTARLSSKKLTTTKRQPEDAESNNSFNPTQTKKEQKRTKEDIYLVETIIDKKQVGKRTFYLVKWEDYPNDQNTWEPATNLKNVKDLVQKFN